ncbi:hypothetical protein BV20DRAFT_1120600 [Pilatotrama ljubarskyi]|nr:hypothetical protein BV20DRAFT_1120600 [Pilatotrama ljubarskyi]
MASTDVFMPPSGPFLDVHRMELLDVGHREKLSENLLWRTVLGKIVALLDGQEIQFTSIDFVRFRSAEHDANLNGARKAVTSRPTIWIGVLPDTTSAEAAFDSSQKILRLLIGYDVHDVDVAYRESIARFLGGSPLWAPVNDFSPVKDVSRRRLDHHRA